MFVNGLISIQLVLLGSKLYEYRHRQSGQLCTQFSPVLEFAFSDCSVIVSSSSTGNPIFHVIHFINSDYCKGKYVDFIVVAKISMAEIRGRYSLLSLSLYPV